MAIYAKKTDLHREIVISKEQDKLTDEAVRMLTMMCNKYSYVYDYEREEDRQECISFATLDCLLYWRGYKPEISNNAFAYFTSVISNGFKKGWRVMYRNVKKNNKISLSTNIYNM